MPTGWGGLLPPQQTAIARGGVWTPPMPANRNRAWGQLAQGMAFDADFIFSLSELQQLHTGGTVAALGYARVVLLTHVNTQQRPVAKIGCHSGVVLLLGTCTGIVFLWQPMIPITFNDTAMARGRGHLASGTQQDRHHHLPLLAPHSRTCMTHRRKKYQGGTGLGLPQYETHTSTMEPGLQWPCAAIRNYTCRALPSNSTAKTHGCCNQGGAAPWPRTTRFIPRTTTCR